MPAGTLEACRIGLTRRRLLGTAAGAGLVTGLGLTGAASAQTQRPPEDLEALAKAARAEGSVTLYSAPPVSVIQRVAKAFAAKYGSIKIDYVRLNGAAVLQRYASEADAGDIACDIIFISGSANLFALDAAKRGWTTPLTDLPVVTSGEYPVKFIRPASAIIQIAPWSIAYRTDKLQGTDIPKDWPDLLAPKFKGEILMADLHAVPSSIQFWAAIADKHGDPYLNGIRAQSPRKFRDVIVALQSLGAGEGLIQIPSNLLSAASLIEKGAPIGMVTPDFTTGFELQVIMTNPAKAKHPNAARLLANFVMSPEGNAVYNDEPGTCGIYDAMHLPRQYVSPQFDVTSRTDHLVEALGS